MPEEARTEYASAHFFVVCVTVGTGIQLESGSLDITVRDGFLPHASTLKHKNNDYNSFDFSLDPASVKRSSSSEVLKGGRGISKGQRFSI